MDYKIQLLSFLASFGFGMIMAIVNQVFLIYVKNKYLVIKYLLATFLAFDIAMFYMALMYKINEGVVHIYFIMVMFIGVYFGNKVNILSILQKLKQVCCRRKK